MNISSYPFLIITFFLLANLTLGFIKGRGVKTVSDFALGNKPFGAVALAASFLATIIGGGAIFGTSKRLVSAGIFALTGFTFTSISYVIMGFLLTNQVSRFTGCVTFGDFIGKVYGMTAKCLAGLLSSINCILNVALSIQILGSVFNKFFGLAPLQSIIFSTLIISVYTAFGGMRAVVATDIFQFIVIGITFFMLIFFSVKGFLHFNELENISFFGLYPASYSFAKALNDIFATRTSLLFFLVKFADVACFQRLLMAKNKDTAKKMYYFSAAVYMTIGIMLLVIVFLGIAVFKKNLDTKDPFTFIVMNFVPDSFIPIIGLGIVSIIFSTGDSWLHVAGLCLSKDLLEPILKRDIKLIEVRVITFLTGIFSMLIVLWFSGLLDLSFLFYLGDPIFAVPVLYAFLGFKSSFRMFCFSAFAGVLGSFLANSFTSVKSFSLFLGCFSSLIAYFSVHYYENKGFKFIGNPILSRTEILILKLKIPSISKIKFRLKRSFEYYNGLYTRFGVVFLLLTICFYVFVATIHSPYFMEMFAFGAVAVILLCLLIPIVMYPMQVRFFMPIYFYLVATYTLPFLVTLDLVLCGFPFVFINIILVVIFSFLSLFERWKHSLLIVCIGASAAIIVSQYIIEGNPSSDFIIRGPSLTKTVLFQTMTCGLGGAIFVSTNENREKRMGKVADYLNNFYKDADLKLKSEVFNKVTKKREKDIDEDKKSRDEIVEKILHSSANKDISKCLESCLELKNQLEKVKEDYISYYIYPELYEIKSLASELRSVVNVAGCSTVSLELENPTNQVRCDEIVIEKTFWKFANEFCVHNINAEQNDSVLTFSTTNIKYSGDIPNMYDFEKLGISSVSALCITLSDREFLRAPISLVKNCYSRQIDRVAQVEFTDPEMRDVIFGVFAHYGVVEMDPKKLIWQCVIPFDYFAIKDKINLEKGKVNAGVTI